MARIKITSEVFEVFKVVGKDVTAPWQLFELDWSGGDYYGTSD